MGQEPYVMMFYVLWMVYFIHSGLQIKHGYPQAPYEQAFMRDTSEAQKWIFRIFKAIPFLWEMKVITDWIVTRTSLDLY